MHHDRHRTAGEIVNADRVTGSAHRREVIPGRGAASSAISAHPLMPSRPRAIANRAVPHRPRRPAEITLPPLPEPRPHLLRVLEGAVIDFPAPVLHPQAQRWAATCWPDAGQPGGWGRALWWSSPYSRGYFPVALDYADIVEFAADIPIRHWWATRWWPVRWYGVVVQDTPRGLVVYGPYPTPDAAQRIGDELRCTLAYYYSTRGR